MSRELEQRLRSELREHAAPGELEAGRRSWAVVEAAVAERAPAPRRVRPLLRLALFAGLLAVGLAAALTPAGAEVGHWIEERIGLGPEESQPTLRGFPGGGRLLAVSDSGAWVVHPGGAMRRLGDYTDAGWSPHGLFVIGTRGHRITAVEPDDGEPRWSLARPGRLGDPAWSPGDGFRIAYLERSGAATSLRVVDGSGRLDHLVARRAARVTPAWRPGKGYVLSFAKAGSGMVLTVDADSGRRLSSARTGAAPLKLAWTRDGRRLVALLPRALRVYRRDGSLLAEHPLPAGARARTMAVHPRDAKAAVALTRRDVSSVLSLRLGRAGRPPRELFTGPGSFSDLEWAPNGRRLLVGWPEANQWLLVGGKRPRAFARVSRQLDPGATGAGFPRLSGWCCARG
jgi:hypothetical protein